MTNEAIIAAPQDRPADAGAGTSAMAAKTTTTKKTAG